MEGVLLGGSGYCAAGVRGTGRSTGLNRLSFGQSLPGTSLSLLGALDAVFWIHGLAQALSRCYSDQGGQGRLHSHATHRSRAHAWLWPHGGRAAESKPKVAWGVVFFFSLSLVQVSPAVNGHSAGLRAHSAHTGKAWPVTARRNYSSTSHLDGWLGNITKEVSVAILLSQWAAAGGPHSSQGCNGNL